VAPQVSPDRRYKKIRFSIKRQNGAQIIFEALSLMAQRGRASP